MSCWNYLGNSKSAWDSLDLYISFHTMVHTVLEPVPGVGPLQESTQGHSGDTRGPFDSFCLSLFLYRINLELSNKKAIVFHLFPRGYSTPG